MVFQAEIQVSSSGSELMVFRLVLPPKYNQRHHLGGMVENSRQSHKIREDKLIFFISEISKESNVRLEFYNGKTYKKVSRLFVSKRLIGSFEFKVADITNFNGYSTGMLSNSFLRISVLTS